MGSLKENSTIEIHDTHKGTRVAQLSGHRDMIDSMLRVELTNDKIKLVNPYINWFVSAGRDRQIILWKLYDGKPLKTVKGVS